MAARAPAAGKLLACLPGLLLCAAMLAAIGLNGAAWPVSAGLAWAGQALPVATAATLCSLVLGAGPAAAGASGLWLASWLVACACVAGWRLLPMPEGSAGDVLRDAVLSLPVMVLLLRASWAALPRGVGRAAAAAGASPATRLRLQLRLALPGVVRACAVVGALCLGLSALRPGLG